MLLKTLKTAGALAAICMLSSTAWADTYPDKPVVFVVPFSAGASPDVMTRIVAEVAAKELGQPIIVENRPGAGGNIAAEYVANRPADGYTVFVGSTANLAVNKTLYRNLRYDPETDLLPLSLAWLTRNVLVVSADSPWNSVNDVITAAKADPKGLNYGSPGSGTAGHLIGEVFNKSTGTQITHIPYKGQNQVIADIMGGTIELSFDTIGTAMPLIQSGKVKGLAITGEDRHALLPDIPTFSEAGIENIDELRGWAMFAVPAKTPEAVVQKLQNALATALEDPSVRERIEKLGVEIDVTTPAESKAMLSREVQRWGDIVKEVGVYAD